MDQRNTAVRLIGAGLYTAAEAARLTSVPAGRIGRWLEGRRRTYKGRSVYDAPLFVRDLPDVDGQTTVSFRDLVELRVIDRFRAHGLSLPYIRKVLDVARGLVGDSHPFTSGSFKTDGKRLYHEVIAGTKEPRLIEVLAGQHAFHSIISIGLKDIEFDAGVLALWRPEAGREEVILDPGRAFGQPILAASGISTALLSLSHGAGRSVRSLARDFEIGERSVRSALAFEAKLAA